MAKKELVKKIIRTTSLGMINKNNSHMQVTLKEEVIMNTVQLCPLMQQCHSQWPRGDYMPEKTH